MENQQTPISQTPSQPDYITDSHFAQDENPSLSATEASISFLRFWFDEASDGKIVFFQIAPVTNFVKRAAILSPADITQEDMTELIDGQNSYFSTCLHDPAKLQTLLDSNPTSRGNNLTASSVHGFGLDIDIAGVLSANSRPLMDFLQRTTKLNEDLIPLIIMTRQLGRLEIANEKLFVLGDSYVKNGQVLSMCGAASEAMPFELVIDDPGDRQFIQKIHTRGLIQEWVEAAKRLNSFPYAKVAMGAEIASALLEDFEVDNFVLNLGNRTSTGKTTLIEFAASVKGRPDGLFITWDSTTVGFERLAETLNNLLIAIDDTKKIPSGRRAKVISSFVYQHASGMGRNRGSLKGRQHLARWRSIMLSTGESTLGSIVEDGGAKAQL